MLTPQEVSEHAFAKATLGGYNMAMVDEFLDQLTEDYSTLYKENAVLKSKMKVLVEKVEEYRSTEDAMRKALLSAQQMADKMVQEAEAKREELIAQAQAEARDKVASLRKEAETEQLRLTAAQNATTAYVVKLKELYDHEMEYLNSLSNFTAPAPKAPDPVVSAAQEIEHSIHQIMEKETDAGADTKELPDVKAPAEEQPGGLYHDLTAAPAAGEAQPESPAAGEEPTRRLDTDALLFGKNYEIK